jgi:hypothetical protein
VEETKKPDVIEQEIIEPAKPETLNDQPQDVQLSEEPSVGSKEYNWRQLEDKHTQEREQLQRKVWELEQDKEKTLLQKDQENEESKFEKDDLITYGQVDELVEKRAEKKARAIFQDEFQKAERAKQPLVVKQQYPDFEKVVTQENIDKLKKEDPELERLILLSTNPYERVYKEIRRSEFYKSNKVNKESEERIAENSKKPISSNSFGKQRPLSYANDYAKGDTNLWSEMQKYRGGSL